MSREETPVVEALVALCVSKSVKCLVQVGAHDGWEAASIQGPTGCRAIAIEADPNLLPATASLEWHTAVIGATDCDTTFYFHKSNAALSGHYQREDEPPRRLPQSRLDTFCRTIGVSPDALIIDTEGTAFEVLEGCGDLLNGVRLIYAECQVDGLKPGMRHVREVDAFLMTRGFTQHYGLPSYGCGGQGNYTWVKP